MNTKTLVLCANCGDGVELDENDLLVIRYYEGDKSIPVVVHCRPCFIKVTR